MKTCCNADHSTRFCPHCGKQLTTDLGIHGLVTHVASTARRQRKAVELSQIYLEEDPKNEDYLKKMLTKQKTQADKWELWESELRSLIVLDGESPKAD